MDGYNTNEEVKRLKPEGHLRSKAQQVIHGLHGKKSPKNQQFKGKNPVVLIAEKIVEGIKQVVDEVSTLIPGDSSQQEVKMSALEQFRQMQAARKAAAEVKDKAAKEALVHSQIQGLRNPVAVDETGRLAGRGLSPELRNKLRAAQGAKATSARSPSPPKPAAQLSLNAASERRAKAVRNYLSAGKPTTRNGKRSRRNNFNGPDPILEAPGSEENVSNNQKGMASQNKPANAVAAGNAAASAAAAAGASPAVVNATANAVANAVANAPPGQEGQVAAAAAEEAVVAAGGNVGQAAAASEAASVNAGGAEVEADRIEQEAAAQEAARAVQNSGAPPAAVEAAANAVASGAPPNVVEAAVVNAGGSPAAAANAGAVASNANAGAANRLAALSGVLPPVASPGAGVVANAPAILNAAAAPALVPGPATSPVNQPAAGCPPVGLAPGTYAATVQRTMTGETAVTFKSTGPQGKGSSWSMPGFSFGSGKGKTVEQQVKEQPKAWTWKGINFGESLKGLKGFMIDLTPLLMALQAVGTVAGGAVAASVGAPMYGAYLIGQGFVLVGLAFAGAFQALAGYDFKKLYPGITLANVFGIGTDPRMKKLAKAISEYQTLNKQGIQQVVNAAKQARSSRFSNNAAVQTRVEAEIKTVKRLLAGKQSEIKAAAKGLAKDIGDALYDKLELKQKEATAQAVTMNPELQNISDKDFEDLELLIQKIYLAASALGNVPEAQYPMAKAEAIKTAFAQFLKDVQVLDELQQLAQGSNAKASVNKMWNKTQKYRSNAASYGRAAQQGLSGFGSRIGSMFTRKANPAPQNVAAVQMPAKKGFFGRLGNSLKSAFSRKPSAAVQKLTAAPAQPNGGNVRLANLGRLAGNRGEQPTNFPIENNLSSRRTNVEYRGNPSVSSGRPSFLRGLTLPFTGFGKRNTAKAQDRRENQRRARLGMAPKYRGSGNENNLSNENLNANTLTPPSGGLTLRSPTPPSARKTRKGRKAGRR